MNAPQWAFFDGHVDVAHFADLFDPGDYNADQGTGEWSHNKIHPLIAQ